MTSARGWTTTALVATLGAIGAVLAAGAQNDNRGERLEAASILTRGGDAGRGRGIIQRVGCGSCHVIPGVPGATGSVGPALAGTVGQAFIAGRLQHTPENLVRWIRDPRDVDPQTAMPDLGLSEDQARDVAAYLYTIRQ